MSSKHILIADDEPHVVRVLRLTLEREGYAVDSAKNSVDALAKIGVCMPDILITDVQMPGGSGRDLCETVRQRYPDHELPILVMSSMTALDGRNWVKGLSRIEFLEKPLSPRNLVAKLDAMLGARPEQEELGHA